MSLGDYLESAVLNLQYGNQALTPPATLYFGLSIGDPGDDGASIVEPAGGAYVRLAKDNNTTTFAAAASSTKAVQIALEWPQATAEWGTITHAFIITAASGGTFYGRWALPVPQYVGENSFFTIPANQFLITMAGASSAYWRHKILDHVFGRTTYSPTGNVYLGLSQTDPQTSITEPGNGYGRVTIANNATNFPTISGDTKVNGVAFQTAVASGSWGTIRYHFLADAVSGGNLLHSAALTTTLYPGAGNYVRWVAGAVSISQT